MEEATPTHTEEGMEPTPSVDLDIVEDNKVDQLDCLMHLYNTKKGNEEALTAEGWFALASFWQDVLE
jgi:hypothetical protein